MSTRQPRFEIVRTSADQPWHARFRAANGRIVWVTENYARRGRAVNAINALTGIRATTRKELGGWSDVGYGPEVLFGAHGLLEVRDVDERAS